MSASLLFGCSAVKQFSNEYYEHMIIIIPHHRVVYGVVRRRRRRAPEFHTDMIL